MTLVLPIRSAGRLREAEACDIVALARVRLASWQTAYAGIVPAATLAGMTLASSEALLADYIGRTEVRPDRTSGRTWHRGAHGRRDTVLMLIEDDEGPFGYALGGPNPALRARHRGEIQELYLHPARWRRGGGTQLLAGALWRLSALGLSPVMLWVLADNPARSFYEACGGRRVGHGPIEVGGATLGRIAYAWDAFLPWPP